MQDSYTDVIQTANILLGDGKLLSAIEYYQKALPLAEYIEQKIDIHNVIARSSLNLNRVNEAIANFEQSIQLHDELPEDHAILLKENKAAVLNNLGVLSLDKDVKKAILLHQQALDIFKTSEEEDGKNYRMHLGNTYLSLGDAFYKKNDLYQAKKHYKKAIDVYVTLENDRILLDSLSANVYYNLGNIANEEHDLPAAKEYLTKALFLYQNLVAQQPETFRSLLAATHNNLAVVSKTAEKYGETIMYYQSAIEQYEILITEKREIYLPYYAATLNNLGIVFTQKHEVRDAFGLVDSSGYTGFGTLSVNNFQDEKKDLEIKKDKENATKYYLKALDVYSELAEKEPENYTHYIATTLHNVGVLMDEMEDYEKAENYYKKALHLRKELAQQYPEAFNADVCVTMLNMVTMNQSLMEKESDLKYKKVSLQLLKEIEERLQSIPEKDRAVIQSMQSDMAYYTAYFDKVDDAYLSVLSALGKVYEWMEEITSVIDPNQKIAFQKQINELLESLIEKHPDNERLQEELLAAYTDYAWLALRVNQLKTAHENIQKGFKLNTNAPALRINMAHYHLLNGDPEKARKMYAEIIQAFGENTKKVIDEDLVILGQSKRQIHE